MLTWTVCLCNEYVYSLMFPYYPHQGGYVIVIVCLSVSLLATLCKDVQMDLHEIVREGWPLTND